MLAQFTVQQDPTTFQKIWAPIETILRTGADVLQRVGPYFIKTPYPITPKGTYQPPIITPKDFSTESMSRLLMTIRLLNACPGSHTS